MRKILFLFAISLLTLSSAGLAYAGSISKSTMIDGSGLRNGLVGHWTFDSSDAKGTTYGANLVADGDMEFVAVSSWSTLNNPTVTKETANPHSGVRNIKIAYIDASNPSIYQGVLAVGRTYRVTGWGRGDGGTGVTGENATPIFWNVVCDEQNNIF